MRLFPGKQRIKRSQALAQTQTGLRPCLRSRFQQHDPVIWTSLQLHAMRRPRTMRPIMPVVAVTDPTAGAVTTAPIPLTHSTGTPSKATCDSMSPPPSASPRGGWR